MSELREAVDTVLPGARADLERLVRIPSIWADPVHAQDTEHCAAVVAEMARGAGAESVRTIRAGAGAPAVLARWPAPPGQPTVLLYAHHDVQPTGGEEHWTSPPFEPAERDGRLYGRGATDDKAGVMAHLAVLRAHEGRPPVGVTLFIEGEEESGSPTLRALLRHFHELLSADVIVIADSANPSVDVPRCWARCTTTRATSPSRVSCTAPPRHRTWTRTLTGPKPAYSTASNCWAPVPSRIGCGANLRSRRSASTRQGWRRHRTCWFRSRGRPSACGSRPVHPVHRRVRRTFPGAAVLVTGVGDPAGRWHGIDESLHLEMFGRVVLAEALLLDELRHCPQS